MFKVVKSLKALKACVACFRKVSNIGKITPRIGLKLFDSFVAHVLEYASEMRSDESIADIEQIQIRYLKMLGVKSTW